MKIDTEINKLQAEVKERINIKILSCIEKHGCKFAYPTQTVYVENP